MAEWQKCGGRKIIQLPTSCEGRSGNFSTQTVVCLTTKPVLASRGRHTLLATFRIGCLQRAVVQPPDEGAIMVLLEMSIVPMGQGESVSQYVAECVDLVDRSGLDYELHAMGTIVEGELPEVLGLMQHCIEKMAEHSARVTCTAKLDYRAGKSGRLSAKVDSVEQKLGRNVKR